MKELGLPSSLSRTDFLGLLLPGALILIALSALFPEQFQGFLTSPTGIIYFVVIAFVLGCLIQAAGLAFDEVLLGSHAFPTHWVQFDHERRAPLRGCRDWYKRLRQDHTFPYLHENQIRELRALVEKQFGVALPVSDQGYSSAWTGIVVQMRAALARRKLDARLQEHIHSFYLYRSMLFTLGCIFLFVVLKIVLELWVGDTRDWGLSAFVVAGLGLITDLLLMYCALRSVFEFARSYARELFTVYLEINREPKLDEPKLDPK